MTHPPTSLVGTGCLGLGGSHPTELHLVGPSKGSGSLHGWEGCEHTHNSPRQERHFP